MERAVGNKSEWRKVPSEAWLPVWPNTPLFCPFGFPALWHQQEGKHHRPMGCVQGDIVLGWRLR